MENFDAKEARRITDSALPLKIGAILMEIKEAAERGKDFIDTKKYLSEDERKELVKRGFRVAPHDSMTLQMDGIYHRIYW